MTVLLDRRLVFVTGKGGVGKSTVAIALGILAARRGLRTIVAEFSSQEQARRSFDHPADAGSEVELAPDLFTISIDPQQAMDEYLQIKTGPLGHVIGSSKLFQAFAMATPGMRELLSIGKVWELAQLDRQTRQAPYDFVVVDAPATGHGLGILRTPRTFADIARVGPIARQGRTIATTLADHEFTAVLAVATPEEMPVNETLQLREALRHDGLALEAVVLNGCYPDVFSEAEAAQLADRVEASDSAVLRAALRAAVSAQRRTFGQHQQRARLVPEDGERLVELPFLFVEDVGRPELEQLADELEGQL